MEAFAEFTVQTPEAQEPIRIESSQSSLIKLDTEISEGESLDSVVLRAMEEANKIRQHARISSHTNQSSQELAASMLRNKNKEDSETILAHQIESLREMEKQNEVLTSQVQHTMQAVTNIEKTIRKKQAES